MLRNNNEIQHDGQGTKHEADETAAAKEGRSGKNEQFCRIISVYKWSGNENNKISVCGGALDFLNNSELAAR